MLIAWPTPLLSARSLQSRSPVSLADVSVSEGIFALLVAWAIMPGDDVAILSRHASLKVASHAQVQLLMDCCRLRKWAAS